MLTHPTLDQLHALGLHGMAKGFKELDGNPEARALDHSEWLALLLEHETTLRRQKRFEARAQAPHARTHRLTPGRNGGRAAAVNGASASRPVAALDLSYS